ncbi:TonB-dependent receptor [Mucilaginibacter hurinus]|uniref:TonB-dependent receptor n=1 Tax=Mucilaginibacter hurinus TaxID=2201324 RepID=A0A367GKK8_9SPHI|nr:TonB-dependent receptor [Mucilaginibacter hurinus]RCH54014.1 TonB-dependent receptor [Mucilaginibacter hurinus]
MLQSLSKFFAVVLSCILFANFAFAQSGFIAGKVIDGNTKLSLPGATLKLSAGNRYTVSGSQGNYEFLNVPAGNYTVTVTYIGFKLYSAQVTVVPGKVAELIVLMEEGGLAGNEVVIMGDRLRGQARALNQQKTNPNITNVVSSDQIGRFPDQNIGDAMKRIPGITMQNDQGEARDIIIRGIAPELNSVSLNGDRIPSAEGDNRRVQMDLIPSDMIQTIEVNKTLTPDMDADAIGGSVNLITRAAPNGLRLSGTLSSGYNPIREKALYTGSLIAGNRFFDNRLGVVLSASYNNNDYGSDDVEAVWKKDDDGNVYVEEQEVRKYDVQRIRRSVSLASDFKIDARNSLSFTSIYNWRDDRENRYRLRYTDIEPDGEGGFVGSIQRETKGGINNGRNKSRRLEDQRVKNFSLRGDHLLGSAINLDWGLSYSDARELRPNERYISFEAEEQPVSLNLSNIQRPLASATTPLADYGLKEITENRNYTKESETGARINLRFPFSVVDGQKGRLRVGGRLRLKKKNRNNNFFEYAPVGSNESLFENLTTLPTHAINLKNFQPGAQYQLGSLVPATFLGNLDLANTSLFEAESVPSEFASINYNAKETITAGYLRWDQDFSEKLSMIAGVRFENTSINYTGNIVEDEEEITGQRTNSNSYLNVLPSLMFKYNADEDLVFRLAATTSIARPNYYDLVPFFDNRIGDQELFLGNENLKAAYAYNLDFMVEKYFSSVGLLSAGVFYKNINNFIYRYRNASYKAADFSNDFPDLDNPIEGNDQWTFIQPRNGDKVNVYGFEVAFQRQLEFLPGFLKHFGVYANYTFTRSKASGIYNADGELRNDVKFPGTAPNLFNFSLSYETKKFTSRLSANFADSYVYELGGEAFEDSYYDKQFFLDANASYRILPKWRIFAEANNLTNQPLRFYQGTKNQTMQIEFYRPRFNVGIKFDM